MKKKNLILTAIFLVILFLMVFVADKSLDSYKVRILNLCAIYVILAVSMNLINGFTGLFSLGHAGFMAIGAYTTALLTMSSETKAQVFFMQPIIGPLANLQVPFPVALLIGGILSALVALLIGAPILRLRGDYLAIATLGFGEIIRVVFTNTQSITNGSMGIKSIPANTNLWWSFATAAITVILIASLINSSHGRALKAIREDEIAAENMGINLFKHKMISFAIGAFFAAVGGGLMASLVCTIDPLMFRFTMTYNILLIIVLGGMSSISGSVISAFVITIAMEALRFLDESINLGFVRLKGISGMRMVVFSILLMVAVLFFRNGLMGNKEFTWDGIRAFIRRIAKGKGDEKSGAFKSQ